MSQNNVSTFNDKLISIYPGLRTSGDLPVVSSQQLQ